jgi:hypothetical protein
MALTETPPAAPAGVEVRHAATDDERLAAARIAAIAFGSPEPAEAPPHDPNNVVYLAYTDGEPIARASGSFSEHGVTLFGGATLPEARGRGAYRALVAARWQDAVARGTPLLVTQAGPMFAADPHKARLPPGVRDPDTPRRVRQRTSALRLRRHDARAQAARRGNPHSQRPGPQPNAPRDEWANVRQYFGPAFSAHASEISLVYRP